MIIKNVSDIAKQMNVDESAVYNELDAVIARLQNEGVKYFLDTQTVSNGKLLIVAADDIAYIQSGTNTRSFMDLVTHFGVGASDMTWLLKELADRNVIAQEVQDYYTNAKNKPSVRAWFEPEAVTVGEKSTLNIEINSPCEILNPKISLEPASGLELEQEPETPSKIFKGKFMEKYGFEAVVFGDLKVAGGLGGTVDGVDFGNELFGAVLKVAPLPPELVVSESQSVYEAVYHGVFRLTLDIANRGSGAAQNVELRGLERHPEFEVLESTKIGNISSHGSIKHKIALKPKKSGAFALSDLSVSFEDLAGKPFSTAVGAFEVQVATLQPKLKVEFIYPDYIEQKRVFPLTLRIANVGDGDARNVTFTLPIDHKYIMSGIVDCNLPKLKRDQTEELVVMLEAPEKDALEVPDLKVEYDDTEDNTNVQAVFGVTIPIRAANVAASSTKSEFLVKEWPFVKNARIGGQYDIVEEIGEGGYAKVFRVRRLKFNEEWALKALKQEYVSVPSIEESFVEEAKIAQKLREDHIVGVQYVDVECLDDVEFPYIIMEYIKGGTLKDKLAEPLDLMTCAEIMKDMCSALLYAHQQGVIHFDVKPSNIFYDDNKKFWKLGDFGLAKYISTNSNVSPRGSLPYMAPEVKLRKGTSKSDIYSLGRVCAEILTGSPDGDIAKADKSYPRESQQKVREFAKIIEKMLNVNPTERPTIVEIQKVFLKSTTWSGNEKRRAI